MTDPDAPTPEMRILQQRLRDDPLELDEQTTERLLAQALAPDDAPPEYRDVARVLHTLAMRPLASELAGEVRAVAAIVGSIAASSTAPARRSSMSRPFRSAKRFVVALTAASALLMGGLAAAGVLPGVTHKDDVTTPGNGPNAASNGHTDERGKSTEDHPAADAAANAGANANAESNGKGSEISDIAHTTDATGVDKGSEISNTASDGRSRAGEPNPSADAPGQANGSENNGQAESHKP